MRFCLRSGSISACRFLPTKSAVRPSLLLKRAGDLGRRSFVSTAVNPFTDRTMSKPVLVVTTHFVDDVEVRIDRDFEVRRKRRGCESSRRAVGYQKELDVC
jgi:hypothetical protein